MGSARQFVTRNKKRAVRVRKSNSKHTRKVRRR